MPPEKRPLWFSILFAAVTVSLGWGLRGYIGGGSLGAMLPGAMAALVLALLYGKDGAAAGVLAAFGAIGIGFGGQETYGQTVGLSMQADTRAWALLGFAIKGGAWGLLGGAFLGIGLLRGESKLSTRDLAAGILLMIAATWLGWRFVDDPKLMYFSNRFDKPREEVWAGLLAGGVALLAWLERRGAGALPLRFAAWGGISGAAGFSLGAWLQAMGRPAYPGSWIDWWKVMEFTFGALLGAGLGAAGHWNRHPAESVTGRRNGAPAWALLVAAAGVSVALIAADEYLPIRMGYTVAGGAAALAAWHWPRLAWQIAISLTSLAFLLDLVDGRPILGEGTWVAAAACALAIAAWLTWTERALPAFVLLTWAATATSLLKTYLPPARAGIGAHAMEASFVAMAVAATWMAWCVRKPVR